MPPPTVSVIPKIQTPDTHTRSPGVNGVLALGVFAVFAVGIAYGGLYAYGLINIRALAEAKTSLLQSEKQFEPRLIATLSSLNRQLTTSKQLLSQHVHISPIMHMLEDTASSSVQYDEFRYEYPVAENMKPEIRLRGQARSYQAIAQQSTTLGNNENVAEHIFSDFKVNANGRVDFILKIIPASDTLMFEKWLRREQSSSTLLPAPTVPS